MERETIARRIAKLLRLAARGGTVEEASAAAAKAQELMDEHRLAEADLDLGEPSEPSEPVTSVHAQGSAAVWRWLLLSAIAKLNGCAALRLDGSVQRHLRVYGRASDLEIVTYLFTYLAREIDKAAKAEVEGRDSRDNFRRGAVMAVVARLKRRHEATLATSSRALVRLDEREKAAHAAFEGKRLGTVKPREVKATDAAIRGHDFGEAIPIHDGVRAGNMQRAIGTQEGERQ